MGIRYIMDETEIPTLPVTHKSKTKLTFCQFLAGARQARYALFMEPSKCLCENAQPVFGFRDLEQACGHGTASEVFPEPGTCVAGPATKGETSPWTMQGGLCCPSGKFRQSGLTPSVVFIMGVPYQTYHLLNDYMAATGKPNLAFFHTPNSAVCSGSVWAFNHHTANMTTMCAGSKTSGKTEMIYMNLFIPGDQFIPTMEQQMKRCEETGGPSLLGKGGQPWPGLDACKSCPMFRFEEV